VFKASLRESPLIFIAFVQSLWGRIREG